MLSKIRCPHVIFSKFFHDKHPTVMPMFGQKNVNFVKTTLYYGPQKSIECHFFPVYLKTHCYHAHISSKKKCPFAKNHNAFMPIFCQKNIHSLNTTVLSCHFFEIFTKKSRALMPTFDQKMSILLKLY